MISALSKKHSFDTVFDGQKVFRLILEAVSNPARSVNISEYAAKLSGAHPAFLALAMTLLDNEASFNACENDELSGEIASLTLAKKEEIESADFVFLSHPGDIKNAIENMKCGTLSDPHKSATVIIRNEDGHACRMKLSGPGIDWHAAVHVTRTVKYAVVLRDARNYEYPQGIDMLFVSNDGGLFAIPRTTRMEAE
jgi:alpha-D-ribose 1-methylphosphonate 5-triphosphate synthase subunit PhnH